MFDKNLIPEGFFLVLIRLKRKNIYVFELRDYKRFITNKHPLQNIILSLMRVRWPQHFKEQG